LFCLGCRISELLAIKVADIDFECALGGNPDCVFSLDYSRNGCPLLTGDARKNSILAEKFLGGTRDNQLLNATVIVWRLYLDG
jgi:hypothetical protein